MKPSEAFEMHREAIRRIVKANRACNPRVFGSVLYHEDTEESDLDLLVDTVPTTSLMDLARIQRQLEEMLGVKVDIRTPKFLPAYFRTEVLAEAAPV